jgi:glycosyltransferase involved in cell wall biosynthesis
MKISFVVPAYNEELYIRECLQSVLDEIERHNIEAEIIVVNNCSTDRTKEIASSFSTVKVVDEFEKGTNSARQRGLVEAQGDLVAFLDADSRLSSEWFSFAEKAFLKNAKLVGISGPYKFHDASKIRKIILESLWKIFVWPAYLIVGYIGNGGNLVAKRETLLAMGGLDKSLKFYGDDTNTAKRLSKFGKVLFSLDFYVYSSSRRYAKHGVIKTIFPYAKHFLLEVFSRR